MIENTDSEQIERLNSRIAELLAEVAALKRPAQGAPLSHDDVARLIAENIDIEVWSDGMGEVNGINKAATAILSALTSMPADPAQGAPEPVGPREDDTQPTSVGSKTMDYEKIGRALKAASSLIVVEVWAPAEHQFEKETRFKAREAVQKMCLEALLELDNATVTNGERT
jgi:hypothetical protein